MSRYCFTVAYDGTDFSGWQIQPDRPTVQQTLQDTLAKLVKEPDVKIHGSGRTDTGVHAVGQVFHADIKRTLPMTAFSRGLNDRLPASIRIMSVDEVSADFHARKSAIGKEYRYFIYQDRIMPPHLRLYRAHVWSNLDVGAMNQALEMLLGTHDFVSFSSKPDKEGDSTVRRIIESNITENGQELCVSVHGDGFLYKMVRSIAGWLIRVGKGEVSPQDTLAVLDSCSRTAAVPTAPPQGLFLWKVFYPSAFDVDNT